MARSKQRRKPRQKKPRSSRLGTMAAAAFVVLGIALVGTVLLGSTGRSLRSEARERPPHNAVARPDAAPAIMDPEEEIARQLADQGWYERVLVAAAAGDARAEELAAFFREHAVFNRLMGGGITSMFAVGTSEEMVRRMQHPLTFEVTPASTEERRRNGLPVLQAWEWSHGRNELFVPLPGTFTDLWAGVVFAHELSHAHDAVTGTEPRGLPPHDPRFIDGEIRAYELEFRLLDLRTDGRWRAAAEAVLDRRAAEADADDWLMLVNVDFDAFDALFPAHLGRDEEGVRGGAGTVMVNFLLNERRGGGIEGQRAFLYSLGQMMR